MRFGHENKNQRMYPTKRYPHFDKVIRFSNVKGYVCNTKKVAEHSFFPLVHYVKIAKRYDSDHTDETESDIHRQHVKIKERDIMYAAHLDGYIYRYYADQLNEIYNCKAEQYHIDSVAIAYRDNKPGLSNIQFAREVFDFIVAHPCCYIRVGDFKHFFDSLQHTYLKHQVKKLLEIIELPSDWYKVLRSVMQYTFVDRKVIAPFYDKRSKCYFKNIKEYRSFRQAHPDAFHSNHTAIGIPQGTALSGVLANIYMMDIDRKIQEFVQSYSGLYRRYSDDTIIVIPIIEKNDIDTDLLDYRIQEWIHEASLSEQEEKTKRFIYHDDILYSASNPNKISTMDYLGFTFNGKEAKVRQKSIYKFERKASTAINHAAAIKEKYELDQLPFKSSILPYYFLNGHKAGKQIHQSNFLDYLNRVEDTYQKGNVSCEPNKQIVKLNRKIRRLYNRVK